MIREMANRPRATFSRMAIPVLVVACGCTAPPRQSMPPIGDIEDVGDQSLTGETFHCSAQPQAAAPHQYGGAPDSDYRWELVREEPGAHGALFRLSLSSQEWHRIPWKHSLLLFLPSEPADGNLLLLVLRQGEPAESDPAALRAISEATGTAAAFLFEIPNQPLFDGLEEDPLLAYTYSQYLRTGDESWPLLFPMVRSVVRAMDAIQEVSAPTGADPVLRYVVAGHSKRGHAAWLAAAVDSRVAGIIPIAIDVLNSREQIAHHRAVAGEISTSSQVFSEVIRAADSPRGRCLMTMIDPFTYRTSLTEPKLVVLGTNDDYTPTDALNLYWEDLPGPGSVLYLPNTSHAGAYSHPSVNPTAFAFDRAVAAGEPLPEIDWSVDARDGVFVVSATPHAAARAVRLWTTQSPDRDFRASTWNEVVMRQVTSGAGSVAAEFTAEAPLPPDGYAALFVEVEFGIEDAFKLTTQIQVVEAGTERIVSTP